MRSSLLIAATISAAWVWGEDFILAPRWFRISTTILIGVALFGAMLIDVEKSK